MTASDALITHFDKRFERLETAIDQLNDRVTVLEAGLVATTIELLRHVEHGLSFGDDEARRALGNIELTLLDFIEKLDLADTATERVPEQLTDLLNLSRLRISLADPLRRE